MCAVKPRELVTNESPNRIRDHLDRKARYNPTKSLTELTSQLSQEYEDRFLVELIQNAYDAHEPRTREGRVHIRLDESGDAEPVLYVANTGRPFTEANFDALTNVAQSSKPPGEGIGNKGVGFRASFRSASRPKSSPPKAPSPAGQLLMASALASQPTDRFERWSRATPSTRPSNATSRATCCRSSLMRRSPASGTPVPWNGDCDPAATHLGTGRRACPRPSSSAARADASDRALPRPLGIDHRGGRR